ncbi:YbdK family carboxylate-amine ligase [Jiangella asiatica]|uniref:Putative glutamate--cysteine ligase 2 n=2 Tax=Jiangella asiatica TaxID=2530372 RepID=A0A4R5DTZ8_9ACTN|nr:YbdK family carboxylate-amine ligase [Jiangella asiatica]
MVVNQLTNATRYADRPSVGVEEEFLLVDPRTSLVVPKNGAVVAAAHRLGGELDVEVTRMQVETRTPVCTDLRELRGEVLRQRLMAAAAARRAGVQLVAAGVPIADELHQLVTDKPRYRRMADHYGILVRESGLCGCHIHVGVADRENAVQLSNHVRPWLPALLALTANSAVHRGEDTGHCSWRTVLIARWPCSGPPPYFDSARDYDAAVSRLLDAGAVLDETMVSWSIRPSHHLPTLEVRVSDVPATADETIVLAALVRGLVAAATREIRAGREAPRIPDDHLRTAYWLAAHDGMTGRALDVHTARSTTPAELVGTLLDHVRADLEDLGDLRYVARTVERILEKGNGAQWQRRALARRGRSTDVVAVAAQRTLQPLDGSHTSVPMVRHPPTDSSPR